MTRPGTSRTLAATGTAALIAVFLAGCGGLGSDDGGGSDDSARPASEEVYATEAPADAEYAAEVDGLDADMSGNRADVAAEVEEGAEPALIKTGTISLVAEDVADARLDARKIIDQFGGTIDEEETQADDDGGVTDARIVLRVPSEDFEEIVERLEGIATLESSTSSSTDVRDRVIRTNVQIDVQEAAIERIEALLDRAENLGNVIRIESELTDRIAKLQTLKRTAAYLADQTSMSTINLYLEKQDEDDKPGPKEDDETGFVAGLERGWDAFSTAAVWVAGAVGTVLPFAGLVLVIGVPAWLLARRRRTTPAIATAAPAPVDAP